MNLLEELRERYEKLSVEAAELDARRRMLMLGMNELLPAIWALESDAAPKPPSDGEVEREVCAAQPPPTSLLPEGFVEWSGGERPVGGLVQVMYRGLQVPLGDVIHARALRWTHLDRASDIIAYRIVTDAERTSDESQATDQDRVEPTTPPSPDVLLENQPGVSSQASSTEATDKLAERFDRILERAVAKVDAQEAERTADGWVPADGFEFPKAKAIVEARWDDGFCETLRFVGYTPTTNEPIWSSKREGAGEAELLITHYRSFPAEAVDDADAWAFSEFMNLTGATKHHGGACPVAVGAHVEIFTRGCREWPVRNIEEVATHWTWKDATPHPTDIIAYREIEAPAEAERTEVESEPKAATEQTGIFQSQTEAALNDKDEPDPAPYAPINKVEEPAGDAAVFARGMMEEAKADAEIQKFNPFRLFRQKEPA